MKKFSRTMVTLKKGEQSGRNGYFDELKGIRVAGDAATDGWVTILLFARHVGDGWMNMGDGA
jgi:hypothetical protein